METQRTAAGRSVFTKFQVFSIRSVDITAYQQGEKFYISLIVYVANERNRTQTVEIFQ